MENLSERLSGSQDAQRSVPRVNPPPLDPEAAAANVSTSDESSATGPLPFYVVS